MKVTLEFNDEEKHELQLAINADLIYSTLWEASQEIRKLLKHRVDLNFTEEQENAIQHIRGDIEETINYIGIR